jgi:hypothetical protein
MILTVMFGGAIAAALLGGVLEEAGMGAQVAVAVAAIAALVLSYVWLIVASLRAGRRLAAGEDEGEVSASTRRQVRWIPVVLMLFPFLMLAARPWGMATIAVAGGAYVLSHFAYIHVILVAGLMQRRRTRGAAAS